MATTEERSVGRLTSLDDALAAPPSAASSDDAGLLSPEDLDAALVSLGVSPASPEEADNPIKERGGILRAFGNAEKKLVGMLGLTGYRGGLGAIGEELGADLAKTDLPDIVQDFGESFGNRTATRIMQTTHDVPTSMLARLGTDRSLFEGAVMGFKGAEQVMGSDLYYKGLAAAGVDSEMTELAWRLRQAKLGIATDEVIDRTLATATDDELHRMMNPHGIVGSTAGFLLDLFADGMNWGALGTSLAKRGGMTASERALANNAEKVQRVNDMKQVMGEFDRATEMMYGTDSPLRARTAGIVGNVAPEMEKVRQGYDVRLAQTRETGKRIASAGERMRAFVSEARTDKQLSNAEDAYQKASKDYARAAFGNSSLLDEPAKVRLVDEYEKAAGDVERLRKIKYDYQAQRGNFEDPEDFLRGLIAASPDPDLPQRAAKEVFDAVSSETDVLVPLTSRADNPLQSSLSQFEYAPAGPSALNARFNDILRLGNDLEYLSMPFTQGRVYAPNQESYTGMVAIKEMERLARERGLAIARGLDPYAPAINNPVALKEVARSLRGAGFPEEWAETVGPEMLVEAHQVGNLLRITNDSRAIINAKTILSPSDLSFQTQQDSAQIALLAAMRRHVHSLLDVNRNGIDVPVGPVEWSTGRPVTGRGDMSMPTGRIQDGPRAGMRRVVEGDWAEEGRLRKGPLKAWKRVDPEAYQGDRSPLWAGKENPGTLPGVKRGGPNAGTEILTLGKRALDRDKVKELRAYERALREGLLSFVAGRRANTYSALEALFGTHAMNPNNPVAKFYKANPAMQRLTAHRFRLPTPALLGWRDPFLVFGKTGGAEVMFDATRSLAEGVHHYGNRFDDILKGMTLKESDSVWRTMLGDLDPMTLGEVQGPRIRDAAIRAREAFDEGFALLGLPPEKYVKNYLTTVLKQNERMTKAMEAGFVPTELMRDVPLIDRMVRMSDVGTEWTSRFAKLRRGTDKETLTDLRDVARIYFNSVLRAKYVSPALDEVGQMLRGSVLTEKPRYGEALRTIGIADLTRNKAQRERMITYFEDLENLIHGKPTKLTNTVSGWAASGDTAETLAQSTDAITKRAAAISAYYVSNNYIGQLAMMAGSALKNLSQQILPAAEYGPLNYLKNVFGYFAKHDPFEIAQNGGFATRKGIQKLVDAERVRVRQDFREMMDAESPLGRAFKWINDKVYMSMLQHGENANRGMTHHVVASLAEQARKSGKLQISEMDVMRMAERASNEAHFVYGNLGRGPVFQSPYTRPFIGILTSYPMKMIGAMARSYRENPTALARYLFMVGSAGNTLSRMGMDPADMVPWGWLPDRFLFFFPEVGLAKLYKGVQGMSKAEPGTEDWNIAVRDFLNGVLFSGILPIPANFMEQMGQVKAIWDDGELRTRADSIRVMPGLKPLVFDNMAPPSEAVYDDEFEKALAIVAIMMGFRPEASTYAKGMRKDMRDMMRDENRHKLLATKFAATYGTLDADLVGDDEEVRAAIQSLTPEEQRNVLERVYLSSQQRVARSLDGLGKAEQYIIRRNIEKTIPDPKVRDQLIGDFMKTEGWKRRFQQMEARARRRREALAEERGAAP